MSFAHRQDIRHKIHGNAMKHKYLDESTNGEESERESECGELSEAPQRGNWDTALKLKYLDDRLLGGNEDEHDGLSESETEDCSLFSTEDVLIETKAPPAQPLHAQPCSPFSTSNNHKRRNNNESTAKASIVMTSSPRQSFVRARSFRVSNGSARSLTRASSSTSILGPLIDNSNNGEDVEEESILPGLTYTKSDTVAGASSAATTPPEEPCSTNTNTTVETTSSPKTSFRGLKLSRGGNNKSPRASSRKPKRGLGRAASETVLGSANRRQLLPRPQQSCLEPASAPSTPESTTKGKAKVSLVESGTAAALAIPDTTKTPRSTPNSPVESSSSNKTKKKKVKSSSFGPASPVLEESEDKPAKSSVFSTKSSKKSSLSKSSMSSSKTAKGSSSNESLSSHSAHATTNIRKKKTRSIDPLSVSDHSVLSKHTGGDSDLVSPYLSADFVLVRSKSRSKQRSASVSPTKKKKPAVRSGSIGSHNLDETREGSFRSRAVDEYHKILKETNDSAHYEQSLKDSFEYSMSPNAKKVQKDKRLRNEWINWQEIHPSPWPIIF